MTDITTDTEEKPSLIKEVNDVLLRKEEEILRLKEKLVEMEEELVKILREQVVLVDDKMELLLTLSSLLDLASVNSIIQGSEIARKAAAVIAKHQHQYKIGGVGGE